MTKEGQNHRKLLQAVEDIRSYGRLQPPRAAEQWPLPLHLAFPKKIANHWTSVFTTTAKSRAKESRPDPGSRWIVQVQNNELKKLWTSYTFSTLPSNSSHSFFIELAPESELSRKEAQSVANEIRYLLEHVPRPPEAGFAARTYRRHVSSYRETIVEAALASRTSGLDWFRRHLLRDLHPTFRDSEIPLRAHHYVQTAAGSLDVKDTSCQDVSFKDLANATTGLEGDASLLPGADEDERRAQGAYWMLMRALTNRVMSQQACIDYTSSLLEMMGVYSTSGTSNISTKTRPLYTIDTASSDTTCYLQPSSSVLEELGCDSLPNIELPKTSDALHNVTDAIESTFLETGDTKIAWDAGTRRANFETERLMDPSAEVVHRCYHTTDEAKSAVHVCRGICRLPTLCDQFADTGECARETCRILSGKPIAMMESAVNSTRSSTSDPH